MRPIAAGTVPELYQEVLWALRQEGVREQSRNGEVIAMQEPTVVELWNPTERVLFCPVRDANPFFHIAEVVWMFAGRNDSRWLEIFNRRYGEYADGGIVQGAYGYRWLYRFDLDQVAMCIQALRRDPHTRRAVIAMWDADTDLQDWRDVPCNTHIYFRLLGNSLDMTVCNRSNDAIWGLMGTNVVLFTYLHEVVAHGIGAVMGRYRVITNNLHIYTGMSRFQQIWDSRGTYDNVVQPSLPILQGEETWADLRLDCARICDFGVNTLLSTEWARGVARPMLRWYMERPRDDGRLENIIDPKWRRVCQEWAARRRA